MLDSDYRPSPEESSDQPHQPEESPSPADLEQIAQKLPPQERRKFLALCAIGAAAALAFARDYSPSTVQAQEPPAGATKAPSGNEIFMPWAVTFRDQPVSTGTPQRPSPSTTPGVPSRTPTRAATATGVASSTPPSSTTRTPTRPATDTAEPATNTPTTEATPTPEKEPLSIGEHVRVWVGYGSLDPFNPSGNHEMAGLPRDLTLDEGSGWVTGTNKGVLRIIYQGEAYEMLTNQVENANKLDLPEVKAVSMEVTRVLLPFNTPFETEPQSKVARQPNTAEQESDGDRLNAINPDEAISRLDIFGNSLGDISDNTDKGPSEAQISAEGQTDADEQEDADTQAESVRNYYPDDFLSGSAVELPAGKVSIRTTATFGDFYGSIIFGTFQDSNPVEQQSRFVIAIEGQVLTLVDIVPKPDGTPNVMPIPFDATLAPGNLDVTLDIAENRQDIVLTFVDQDGQRQRVSHTLRSPLGQNVEFSTMRDANSTEPDSRGIAISFNTSPDRAQQLAQEDENLRKAAEMTDERYPLHKILNHKNLVAPVNPAGWWAIAGNPAGLDTLRNDASGGLVLNSAAVHRDSDKRDRFADYDFKNTVLYGYVGFKDAAVQAEIERMRAEGSPHAKGVYLHDMRDESVMFGQPNGATIEDMRTFSRIHFGAYTPDWVDATFLLDRSGKLEDAIKASVSPEFRPRTALVEDWAEAYAKTVMASLPDGVTEYHGLWVLEPSMPLTPTHSVVLARQVRAAQSVEGFNVDLVFPVQQGVNVQSLKTFIESLNAQGVRVGLLRADAGMDMKVAADLTRNQLSDGIDAFLSLNNHTGHPPVEANPTTRILELQIPARVLRHSDAYRHLIGQPEGSSNATGDDDGREIYPKQNHRDRPQHQYTRSGNRKKRPFAYI